MIAFIFSAQFLTGLGAGAVIGLFLGLWSRGPLNYDHQFQDQYLPEEPRDE